MKSEEKIKELYINETAITIEVDSEVIEGVRNGDIRQLALDTKEDELNLNELQFIVLTDGDDHCLTRILEVELEEPNDGSGLWKVRFNIVPLLEEPRKYLMRWNPSISSFTESDYEDCLENMEHGLFRLNWSIYEWEEARRGDMFYMLRVGDNKAGIVFSGLIVSDPYVMDDWAGSSKRRLYVDLVCMRAVAPDEKPIVPLTMLQTAIPEFNWAKGHSGVLLPDNVADKMVGLMDKDAPLLN